MNYYAPYELANTANKILVDYHRNILTDEDQKDELTWNKSLFVAHLLYKSELELQLDEKKLDEEIQQYNNSNGTSIQKEVLVANFLVRYIFGEVKIPSLVSGHSIKMYEEEDFRELYKNEDLFNELIFLGFLITKYSYEDSRPFIITEYAFREIYHKFAELYLQIPTESEILESLSLDEINEYLYCYNSFYLQNKVDSKKVVAYLWKLFSNNHLMNDLGIKKCLLLTEQFHGCGFIQMFDSNEQNDMAEKFVQLLLSESDLKLDNQSENQRLLCDLETHERYETDLFLKKDENILSINYNDYFLMWCTYNSSSRSAYISNDYRKLYSLPLLSLVYTNQYDKNIQLLLNDREKRPYVLFKLLWYIKNNRPGYLIQFIAEKDYGLIFYFTFIDACLDAYFQTSNKIKRDSIEKLLQECVSIFVEKTFPNLFIDCQNFSRFLMYVVKYQNAPERRIDDVSLKKSVYKLHIEGLENFLRKRKPLNYHAVIDFFLRDKKYILPTYRNIGIEQFTFLFNLLDFANLQGTQDAVDFVVNSILELYKVNILDNKEHYVSIEYKIIEEYNWSLFYKTLINKNKINDFDALIRDNFITPSEKNDLSYEEKSYNANLYKFYLKTLCLAYRQNKIGVENDILNLLEYCFVDDFASRRLNVFASVWEYSYDGNAMISIFPLIMDVSNSFEPKYQNKLISLVLDQGNFVLLFSAYNLITYAEGRKKIEDYVQKADFSSKIDEIYTVYDFLNVTENVANSGISEDFEKILLNELNRIISQKANADYVNKFTFQAELLNLFRTYKNGDVEALKKYKFPYEDKSRLYSALENQIEFERLFYLALALFEKDDYKKSLSIFEDLIQKCPKNEKYLHYKLYVCSHVITKKEERDGLIDQITQELRKATSEVNLLLLTKLNLLILNEDVNSAYCFFETLDESLKKDFSFANPLVRCLIDNNMVGHALAIYKNIDSTTCSSDEYKELSSLLPINQIVSEYQNTYCQMLCLPDDYRFSVLPGKINPHNADIGTYVLNEIKYALKKILKKIDMVGKITANNLSEDNISDLLEIEINSRLSMLDYKLENQDRSGKSSSGVNAGEIDLEINLNDFSIVIEAVKFSRGPSERKKHIEKTLNYDPSKKYIFDLIYFDVNQDFEASWNTVKTEIDSANYPSGYQKRSTNELPSNNAGVKIAVSNHDGGLVFYHIMANFYYAK